MLLDFANATEKVCAPAYTHNTNTTPYYRFLGDAKQHCARDPVCIGILDEFCDKQEYKLCREGTIGHSDVGSCVYTKSKF